jgi:hypothetical protein
MTTDLQTLKATAQATAEKCPDLLVTVPAGVMVELIRDVERYRWMRDHGCPSMESWFYELRAGEITNDQADAEIDEAMAKEDQ